LELMAMVDEHIAEPVRDVDKPFLMPIEDTFSIAGRGTVVTGKVEYGKVNVGDDMEVVGFGNNHKTTITGVEMFRKNLDYGMAGDNIGALVRGLKREDIRRGQVLCAPGTQKVGKKFEAEIYCLKQDEGGRHTPFVGKYRPQFYIRTADVTGSIELKEGTEMVMPGDNATVDVELIAPVVLEQGVRFSMREGEMMHRQYGLFLAWLGMEWTSRRLLDWLSFDSELMNENSTDSHSSFPLKQSFTSLGGMTVGTGVVTKIVE